MPARSPTPSRRASYVADRPCRAVPGGRPGRQERTTGDRSGRRPADCHHAGVSPVGSTSSPVRRSLAVSEVGSPAPSGAGRRSTRRVKIPSSSDPTASPSMAKSWKSSCIWRRIIWRSAPSTGGSPRRRTAAARSRKRAIISSAANSSGMAATITVAILPGPQAASDGPPLRRRAAGAAARRAHRPARPPGTFASR